MSQRRPPRRDDRAARTGEPADLTLRSELGIDEPDRDALASLASGRSDGRGVADPFGDERWVAAADAALDADATREFWGDSARDRTPRRRSSGRRRTVRSDEAAAARRRPVRADGSLERTRSHRVVEPRPVDGARPVGGPPARRSTPPDTPRRAAPRGSATGVDPLLLRLGAIVVVGVLLVPIVMAMRSAGDAGSFGLRTIAAGETAGWLPLPAVARTTPLEAATEVANSVADAESTEPDASGEPAPDPDVGADPVATAAGPTTATVVETTPDAPTDYAPTDNAPATTAPACALDYTVGAGDYWLRLADESGVALADLLRANGATIETPLYPGDEVCLPAGARRPAPPPAPTTAAPASSGGSASVSTTPASAGSSESNTSAAPATTAPPTTTPPATTPPATTPPTTVPPTTTSAPVARATPDEVRQMIREVWPEELHEKALEVADRESRFVSDAYNGWCCYGVFQIHWSAHRTWLSTRGVTSASQLHDARLNVELAYEIYQRAGGWGPWSQTAY